jgi:hypothetical protein
MSCAFMALRAPPITGFPAAFAFNILAGSSLQLVFIVNDHDLSIRGHRMHEERD